MPNEYFWERISGRDRNLRAADADRERTAARLRTSHAEGRLDMAEFQQRLEHCYEAKTLGDLRDLVADLPGHDEDDERRSLERLQPPYLRLARLAPILIAVILASAVIGHHVFWLWIPLVFLLWRMSWWRRRRWFAAPPRGPGE